MEIGFSYDYLINSCWFDILNIYRAHQRRIEIKNSMVWYQETERQIQREARELIKTGNGSRQPSEAEIQNKINQLRRKYYRYQKPEKETNTIITREQYEAGRERISRILREQKKNAKSK